MIFIKWNSKNVVLLQEKVSNFIPIQLALSDFLNTDLLTKTDDGYVDVFTKVQLSNNNEVLDFLEEVEEVFELTSYSADENEIKVVNQFNPSDVNQWCEKTKSDILESEKKKNEKDMDSELFINLYNSMSKDEQQQFTLKLLANVFKGGKNNE